MHASIFDPLANIFAWPFTSMIPVLGRDRLHLGPEGIGLLASLDGVGAFLGAVALALFLEALTDNCGERLLRVKGIVS